VTAQPLFRLPNRLLLGQKLDSLNTHMPPYKVLWLLLLLLLPLLLLVLLKATAGRSPCPVAGIMLGIMLLSPCP
jgi:hypothetical protein